MTPKSVAINWAPFPRLYGRVVNCVTQPHTFLPTCHSPPLPIPPAFLSQSRTRCCCCCWACFTAIFCYLYWIFSSPSSRAVEHLSYHMPASPLPAPCLSALCVALARRMSPNVIDTICFMLHFCHHQHKAQGSSNNSRGGNRGSSNNNKGGSGM